MSKFIRDITTGRDNKTHDVVRSSMAVIVGMLPIVMLWGLGMETWAFHSGKPFDLQASFNAILVFLSGASAFLMGGSAALLLKIKTEPDGSVTQTEQISEGHQPDNITKINETIIAPN